MGGLIGKVTDVCLSVEVEDRKELHRDVIGKLKKVFVEGGYQVYLEYPIWFDSIVRKSGAKVRREGYVDLVAVKNGRRIAIEFDTGVHVKFKSIEKLLQVEGEACIAIVRGSSNGLQANIDRIEEVKKEFGFLKEDLWLIVLCERTVRKV